MLLGSVRGCSFASEELSRSSSVYVQWEELGRLPTYESDEVCGRTGGFALQRQLEAGGIECQVIAPALIPRRPGDRVKTDRRDARKLAELLRADLLTAVHPPTIDQEAVREHLEGGCDDQVADVRLSVGSRPDERLGLQQVERELGGDLKSQPGWARSSGCGCGPGSALTVNVYVVPIGLVSCDAETDEGTPNSRGVRSSQKRVQPADSEGNFCFARGGPSLKEVSNTCNILTQRKVGTVSSLPQLIEQQASDLPEGAVLHPKALLHLGSRAAIDQALSRLARSGRLLRVCQGVYVHPVETRFGSRPPAFDKVVASLSTLWGETIIPCGGAEANALGLTTQVPVRSVYLTSGPDRRLKFGEVTVELRHAPRWQLAAPHRPAGRAVRALAWLGPEEIETNLEIVERRLSKEDIEELAETRAVMPAWIAEPVSALIASG